MRPRKYKHPPQGVHRIVKPSYEPGKTKMAKFKFAGEVLGELKDIDVWNLIDAFDDRQDKEIKLYLKLLKDRYREEWKYLGLIIQWYRAVR